MRGNDHGLADFPMLQDSIFLPVALQVNSTVSLSFNSLLRTSHQLLVMQQLAVALAATGPAHGTGTESHSLIIP